MNFALPNKWPFKSVFAFPLENNKVKLQWSLMEVFSGNKPWKFQPQINYYGGDPDQWQNLGPELEDVFETTEEVTIPIVKNILPLYRIKLTYSSPPVVHYSDLAVCLPYSLQLEWQAIIRRLRLQKRSQPVRRGVLLKRKLNGPECPQCIDELTKQITRTDCNVCYGTGIVGGYWIQDEPNVIVISEYQSISDVSTLGHIDPIKRQCFFIGLPVPAVGDVWIDTTTNRRYIVREATSASVINDIPIVTKALLGLLPSGDIAYKVEI